MDARTHACCRCILEAARHGALRLDLAHEEAEDCAQGFLAHVWRDGHCALADEPPAGGAACGREAALRRSARNWASNHRRALRARGRLETPWPLTPAGHAWEAPDHRTEPGAALARKQARAALWEAMSRLTGRQREVLARFYERRETCQQIADALATSRHAVQQSLHAARGRLRRVLGALGHDRGSLLADLCSPLVAPPVPAWRALPAKSARKISHAP